MPRSDLRANLRVVRPRDSCPGFERRAGRPRRARPYGHDFVVSVGGPIVTSVAPRVVFQLRLKAEELDRWRAAAQKREETLAELVRRAVEEEIGGGWEAVLADVARLRD